MLFLSDEEKAAWAAYARDIAGSTATPAQFEGRVRTNLVPAFEYYIAVHLAGLGQNRRAVEWLEAATLCEEDGLFSAAFLMSFLSRHNGALIKPATAFEDPRPYLHFAGVPVMQEARRQLVRQFAHSLPAFKKPLRFMDIGCGDGSLTAMILSQLTETGKADTIGEVLLVDASPAMIALARETVSRAFPEVDIRTVNSRIQDCSASINSHYDIAMSSLAYHHMPVEDKRLHLSRLKPWIDHFLLFEMDANNDTPEISTPELALSVYQSYGRIMDFVYAHDAPVEIVTDCIDSFLMTEVVSLLTQPRGERTEYHMLRSQWHDLFRECLSPEFSLCSDSTCYADEYITLFTLHYGRRG
jgi:SAM-dependent methyltransferase